MFKVKAEKNWKVGKKCDKKNYFTLSKVQKGTTNITKGNPLLGSLFDYILCMAK